MKSNVLLTVPYRELNNSYSILLNDNLSKFFDVRICSKSFGPFSILFSVVKNKAKIVHVDWIHMYYSHPNSIIKTLIKSLIFYISLKVLCFLNVKFIVSMHNIRPHDSIWKKLDFFFNSMLLRNTVLIRAFTSYNAKIIRRFYKVPKERIVTFYEGTSSTVDEAPKNNNFFDKKIIFKGRPNFLIIGQIRRYKRIIEALSAISPLIKTNAIHVTIAGNIYDKNYFSEIEEFNRNFLDSKVDIIAKFLDEKQFDAYIRSSDAVIVNSKTNYNSGVLARCITLKKPCLIKKQFGNHERMLMNKQYLFKNGITVETVRNFLKKNKSISDDRLYKTSLPTEVEFCALIDHLFK